MTVLTISGSNRFVSCLISQTSWAKFLPPTWENSILMFFSFVGWVGHIFDDARSNDLNSWTIVVFLTRFILFGRFRDTSINYVWIKKPTIIGCFLDILKAHLCCPWKEGASMQFYVPQKNPFLVPSKYGAGLIFLQIAKATPVKILKSKSNCHNVVSHQNFAIKLSSGG